MQDEWKTNGTAGLCELSQRTDVNSDLPSAVMSLLREKMRQTFADKSSAENNGKETNSSRDQGTGVEKRAMESSRCVPVSV